MPQRPLTATQLNRRRQVEQLIRVAAPVLDGILFAGEQLSKAVSRNELPPAPERRVRAQQRRTPIGGPPSS